jgi:AraC-like DNA-binding protein
MLSLLSSPALTTRARAIGPRRHLALVRKASRRHARAVAIEPQVAALLVRRLVDVLVERGIGRDALLREARVPPGALGVMRVRLPWSIVEDLLEAAETLTGDDRLGFHIARSHDVETLALPGLLFFASPTLADGMRRLERVQRLWSSAYRGTLVSEPPGFRFVLHRPERRACVHVREQALADTLLVARSATGARVAPQYVRFAHPRSGDLTDYESFFDAPVTFGAQETEMRFYPEDLARPLVTRSPFFAAHFERQAEAELARLPAGTSMAGRVRALIEEDVEALAASTTDLTSIARRLRLSPRTLQRALRSEGTSFAAELDRVRHVAAEARLTAGEDIAELSFRLGFAEPAAFHRAFKRWTGATPDAFRRAAAARRA